MVSEKQRIEMLRKLSSILMVLNSCHNIDEITRKTGIPSSTVQRYLNRKDLLFGLLKDEGLFETTFQKSQTAIPNTYQFVEQTFEQNKEWLQNSKKEGLSRGGLESQRKYGYSKNEVGKFNGPKRS